MNKLFLFSLAIANIFFLYGMKGSTSKKGQFGRLRAGTIRRSSSDPGHPKGTDIERRTSISSETPSWLTMISKRSPKEQKSSKKTFPLGELLLKPEDLELSYDLEPDATLAVLMRFMADKGYLYHHLTIAHKNDPKNTEAAVLRFCVEHEISCEQLYNEHYNKWPADAIRALKVLILHKMKFPTLLKLFAIHQSGRTKRDLAEFLNKYNHRDEVIAQVEAMQKIAKEEKKHKKKKKKTRKKSGTQIHQFSSRGRIQRPSSQEVKTSTAFQLLRQDHHAGREYRE